MRVEIDIYSGRPNPSWDLTTQEAGEFHARLLALPRSLAAAMPDGLGYRGLRVAAAAGTDDATPGQPGNIAVVELGAGMIRLQRADGAVEYYADTTHSLECWLLAKAQGRTDETARQAALANLAPHCP
jgi:hypothetical protein